jgi:hypothetical protein
MPRIPNIESLVLVTSALLAIGRAREVSGRMNGSTNTKFDQKTTKKRSARADDRIDNNGFLHRIRCCIDFVGCWQSRKAVPISLASGKPTIATRLLFLERAWKVCSIIVRFVDWFSTWKIRMLLG